MLQMPHWTEYLADLIPILIKEGLVGRSSRRKTERMLQQRASLRKRSKLTTLISPRSQVTMLQAHQQRDKEHQLASLFWMADSMRSTLQWKKSWNTTHGATRCAPSTTTCLA